MLYSSYTCLYRKRNFITGTLISRYHRAAKTTIPFLLNYGERNQSWLILSTFVNSSQYLQPCAQPLTIDVMQTVPIIQ